MNEKNTLSVGARGETEPVAGREKPQGEPARSGVTLPESFVGIEQPSSKEQVGDELPTHLAPVLLHLLTVAELENIAKWLENGCSPTHAAEELRLLAKRHKPPAPAPEPETEQSPAMQGRQRLGEIPAVASTASERREAGVAAGDCSAQPGYELQRYKQALQRANGFLIMNNLEPVKLEYRSLPCPGESREAEAWRLFCEIYEDMTGVDAAAGIRHVRARLGLTKEVTHA